VTTTSDQKLDSAANNVESAIDDLAQIVIHQCSGHDEYKEIYKNDIEEAFQLLLRVRKRLNRTQFTKGN